MGCVRYKTHGIELVDMVKGNDDRQIKYFANRPQINNDSTIYIPSRILSATYSCEAQIPPMAVRVAKLIKD